MDTLHACKALNHKDVQATMRLQHELELEEVVLAYQLGAKGAVEKALEAELRRVSSGHWGASLPACPWGGGTV